MEVRIVTFSATTVAAITHLGPPEAEHNTVRKLINWKLASRLLDPARYRSYGLHYTDSRTVEPECHRVDFCLSIDEEVTDLPRGMKRKTIPQMQCAYARDVGSRLNNKAAAYLYEKWLPGSGKELLGYPIIFHYVNVGPGVKEDDAITDVYLPVK